MGTIPNTAMTAGRVCVYVCLCAKAQGFKPHYCGDIHTEIETERARVNKYKTKSEKGTPFSAKNLNLMGHDVCII